MTLSSPNEPTEGPGELPVFDSEGFFVGHVRSTEEEVAPSEDLARVVVHLAPEAQRRYGLDGDTIDVEATWLEAPDVGDRLVLNRPLGEALVEQGFDI